MLWPHEKNARTRTSREPLELKSRGWELNVSTQSKTVQLGTKGHQGERKLLTRICGKDDSTGDFSCTDPPKWKTMLEEEILTQ
jgi:hypothetical protein